jgi:hypothetical protein
MTNLPFTSSGPWRFAFLLPLALILNSVSAQEDTTDQPQISSAQRTFVETKVIPLLEARCFECHGDIDEEVGGGLYLTSRKSLLTGGDSGPAIMPGDSAASLIIEAVRYESFEMPPRTRMPKEEVDILVRWIDDGAPWPEDLAKSNRGEERTEFPLEARKQSHWAWHPIVDPEVPQVTHQTWPTDDIDRYILSRLEAAELTPASDTDRQTLVRRLYFDLIGLPPTLQQARQFIDNPAPDQQAIAELVDQLLNSPHFGERWGRHWLDLVRYAETLGHEFDYPLHGAWRYRDYVIRAFNADVPYDQLMREHIAGDLLPSPRRHPTDDFNESLLGTGFWFLGEAKHAPVDVKGEEAGCVDNQLDVFSKAFLGLTVACARCHDHKFDAISTKDYYALAGFLQSSRRATTWIDPGKKIQQQVDQLNTLRQQAATTSQQLTREYADPSWTQKHVQAALQVLKQSAQQPTDPVAVELFDDFEQDTFTKWQVTGEAFFEGPVAGPYAANQKLTGHKGQKLANSYRGSDRFKGQLTSAEFVIQHPRIAFLIAGGNHPLKTCINLVVDGKTVRTATGDNSDALQPHEWDVSDLLNKPARLQIVDDVSGGWGHIDIDQIEFRSAEHATFAPALITQVATQHACDALLLARWVTAIHKADPASTTDPLAVIAAIAKDQSSETDQSHASVTQWKNSCQPATPDSSPDIVPMADLTSGLVPAGWFATGPAFAHLNSDSGDQDASTAICWTGDGPQHHHPAGISSAQLSNQLTGVLSSPTFELTHPEILVRASGVNCRLRLVIDGYVMNEFSELLFKGARQPINTDGQQQWIRLGQDVHRYIGHRAHLEFLDEGDGWFVIHEIQFADKAGAQPHQRQHVSDFNSQLASNLPNASSPDNVVDQWSRLTAADSGWLLDAGLVNQQHAANWTQLTAKWSELANNIDNPVPVLAMTEGTGEDEFVFIRGSHRNLGEPAPRGFLDAISGTTQPSVQSGSGRLELCEKMLAEDNPFPARVAVNRIWHHLLGQGIVASTDNFGVLGQAPSHPQLLDHLASRFRRNGWSMKQLIRDIVLTRTYRLSSQPSDQSLQVDPTNSLLQHARIRRLEGETIRDAILTISGRLDPQLFGAPVPVHLTAFMQGRGRPGTSGPLDGKGRRSIYISVNRNFLSPFMQAFDVPAPVTTIGDRGASNVPAQALIMLNNEFVAQQSRQWATRLLQLNLPARETLQQACREIYIRDARPQEIDRLLQFAALQASERQQQTDSDGPLSIEDHSDICHVLLNTKEFIFVN